MVTVWKQRFLPVCIEITFKDQISIYVVFTADCVIYTAVDGHGLIGCVIPRFIDYFSIFIEFLADGAVSLCMRYRLSVGTKVLFICNISLFIIFPLQCGISVFEQNRFIVQEIFYPFGPVFFVKHLLKFIVSCLTGDFSTFCIIRLLTDRVSTFVKLAFNPAVCITSRHWIAFGIKPSFTCEMLRIQISAFYPVEV